MAGELLAQSSDRHGAVVRWITLHTAEGPEDEFPSRPDLDAGSARDLLRFFQGKTDRSCHAIADDDVLLDGLVPYDRAAWTLRNGNPNSDNLEMCGLASWSRAEWLTHRPMLTIAARWIRARCAARGITPRRLSVAQVAGRSARGYIDHWTYTQATHDGTHWDCGANFPWDVFGALVNGGDDMPDPADLWSYPITNPDSGARITAANRLLDVERRVLITQTGVGQLAGQLAAVSAKLDRLLAFPVGQAPEPTDPQPPTA